MVSLYEAIVLMIMFSSLVVSVFAVVISLHNFIKSQRIFKNLLSISFPM
ncbi:putative holin-like toxin [Siminovitchia terrae]